MLSSNPILTTIMQNYDFETSACIEPLGGLDKTQILSPNPRASKSVALCLLICIYNKFSSDIDASLKYTLRTTNIEHYGDRVPR